MPIAIQMSSYGPPEVLKARDVPAPRPGPGEVVVRMVAAAVNRADCEIRAGHWTIQKPHPFPYTPGLEVAGVIEEVGAGVHFSPGDHVLTMMQKLGGIHGIRPGGYQELALLPANTLAMVSKDVALLDLATLGLGAVTAANGLKKLELQPQQRIVIIGAAGGVGSNAVQIARSLGAWVIAPVRSASEASKMTGVDEVWDLSEKPLKAWATEKVDAVLEMVGGQTFADCVAILKRHGRLCSIGALTGGEAHLSIWDLLHELTLTGWSSENMNQSELQSTVDQVTELLRAGRISVPKRTLFNLTDAAQAHALMESGANAGRILLVPTSSK